MNFTRKFEQMTAEQQQKAKAGWTIAAIISALGLGITLITYAVKIGASVGTTNERVEHQSREIEGLRNCMDHLEHKNEKQFHEIQTEQRAMKDEMHRGMLKIVEEIHKIKDR